MLKLMRKREIRDKIRERRPAYYVKFIPAVIECMGGANRLEKPIVKMLEANVKRAKTWC